MTGFFSNDNVGQTAAIGDQTAMIGSVEVSAVAAFPLAVGNRQSAAGTGPPRLTRKAMRVEKTPFRRSLLVDIVGDAVAGGAQLVVLVT